MSFSDEILINAPSQAVWDAIFAHDAWARWMAVVFEEEALRYEGKFKSGATVRFVSSSGGGRLAKVLEWRPLDTASWKFTDVISNGRECDFNDVPDERAKGWIGRRERFSLKSVDLGDLDPDSPGEHTLLSVLSECPVSWNDHFDTRWPDALEKIKEIAEAKK